jgi:hypothetical protein
MKVIAHDIGRPDVTLDPDGFTLTYHERTKRTMYVAMGRAVIVDHDEHWNTWMVWSNYQQARYSIISATEGLREIGWT